MNETISAQGPSASAFSVADAIAARVAEGGIVLWVLAGFSIVALAIVLVKTLQFTRARIWSRAWLREVWREASTGPAGMATALARVRLHPSPVARIVEAVLSARIASASSQPDPGTMDARTTEQREAELREEVERVAHEQLGQLESGLRGLESIGTLAPLLGLLGTVLGMIRAFAQLEQAGRAVDPSILSGGIWEALLTTAVGLAVAIPALAALAWLDAQVESVRLQLGDVATRVLAAAAWRTHSQVRVDPVDATPAPAAASNSSEPQHAL